MRYLCSANLIRATLGSDPERSWHRTSTPPKAVSLFGLRGCFFNVCGSSVFYPELTNRTNMKRVKLTSAQHAWICCKMSEAYRQARLNLQDLRKPNTISFYERYDAMGVYRDLVDEYVRQCHFLESLRDVMVGKEALL